MPSESEQDRSAELPTDKHFRETEATLERWPELRGMLAPMMGNLPDKPETALLYLFESLDRRAARLQAWHQWCSGLATVCGTVALVLAVAGIVAQSLGKEEPSIDEF